MVINGFNNLCTVALTIILSWHQEGAANEALHIYCRHWCDVVTIQSIVFGLENLRNCIIVIKLGLLGCSVLSRTKHGATNDLLCVICKDLEGQSMSYALSKAYKLS